MYKTSQKKACELQKMRSMGRQECASCDSMFHSYEATSTQTAPAGTDAVQYLLLPTGDAVPNSPDLSPFVEQAGLQGLQSRMLER